MCCDPVRRATAAICAVENPHIVGAGPGKPQTSAENRHPIAVGVVGCDVAVPALRRSARRRRRAGPVFEVGTGNLAQPREIVKIIYCGEGFAEAAK